jgi:hypothetical protein
MQGAQIRRRILMTGHADEANGALSLRFEDVLHRATRPERPVDVVDGAHAVKLPEIEMIGPQPTQASVEMAGRALPTAVHEIVGLRHEEDLIASTQRREGGTQPALGGATVVALGVVEESDAFGQRRLEQRTRGALRSGVAQVPAAETEDREHHAGSAESAFGQWRGGGAPLARRFR